LSKFICWQIDVKSNENAFADPLPDSINELVKFSQDNYPNALTSKKKAPAQLKLGL